MYIALWYFLCLNIRVFVLFWLDKRYAKTGQWRITERKLLYLTMIGWWMWALAGMSTFRHKTVKSAFLVHFWIRAGVRVVIMIAIAIVFAP